MFAAGRKKSTCIKSTKRSGRWVNARACDSTCPDVIGFNWPSSSLPLQKLPWESSDSASVQEEEEESSSEQASLVKKVQKHAHTNSRR